MAGTRLAGLLLFILQTHLSIVNSLQCHQCSGSGPCVTVTCGNNQSCYSATYSSSSGFIYTNGCVQSTRCDTDVAPQVIGRRYMAADDAAHLNCLTCCHGNLCNSKSCTGMDKGAPCVDTSPTCQQPDILSYLCPQTLLALSICRQSCNMCPIDGQWTVWTQWSECLDRCPAGKVRSRQRECSNPSPSSDALPCVGPAREEQICAQCLSNAIDGNWSEWSAWSMCNATCGTSYRVRTCSNPVPQNGGQPCSPASSYRQEKSCQLGPCPVNGHWSSWGPWTHCSVTCDGGLKYRARSCSNPTPANGGLPCTESTNFRQVAFCNTAPCQGGTL